MSKAEIESFKEELVAVYLRKNQEWKLEETDWYQEWKEEKQCEQKKY